MYGLTSITFFFKFVNDRAFADFQYPPDIPDTAVVDGHRDNFFFHARIVGIVPVVGLEGLSACIASPTLAPVGSYPVFDEVVPIAVAAFKPDVMFHKSCFPQKY
jgi:hypothetical protein